MSKYEEKRYKKLNTFVDKHLTAWMILTGIMFAIPIVLVAIFDEPLSAIVNIIIGICIIIFALLISTVATLAFCPPPTDYEFLREIVRKSVHELIESIPEENFKK